MLPPRHHLQGLSLPRLLLRQEAGQWVMSLLSSVLHLLFISGQHHHNDDVIQYSAYYFDFYIVSSEYYLYVFLCLLLIVWWKNKQKKTLNQFSRGASWYIDQELLQTVVKVEIHWRFIFVWRLTELNRPTVEDNRWTVEIWRRKIYCYHVIMLSRLVPLSNLF